MPLGLDAGLGEVGSLPGRRGKVAVAPAAAASAQKHLSPSGLIHIGDHHTAFLFAHHRAHGHLHDQFFAALALPAAAGAVGSGLGLVFTAETEVQQRVHILVRQQHYVAAPAAVTAVRPAVLHKLLPMKGNAAVPAVARLGDKRRAVHKSRHTQHLPVENPQRSV